ncbi:bifunctional metallophosphatase/5'-nucleotidase [Brachybacterium sp. P6-10-X1]|uniref:bifunctional metallophosphatase/5'-nucleotidase n=1 Tax=Brachybacterium sp. P6-10-X1 TaxID=1903186 RepID=UPI0009719AE7|nr:bifunctional UDP-sugar hydrolase/5'-nucleotidase [Brachybacterium sp. P6-10-X1]APX33037.1 bifunctional metallophosphatase/5'-nucleotidase [Brachybacterium sp. P6-10-X1]
MFDIPARRLARGVSVGLGAAALVAASAVVPLGAAVAAEAGDEVNLLTFNDFHGALDAGDAFACTVVTAQGQHDNSALLSAGDNVGGSAFVSAVADDEPTLDFLNALGVDASAIGNHEYDQGQDDLNGRISDSADFPYLAANVFDEGTDAHAQQPYAIVDAGDVKVAVVGAVTTKTLSKVSPAGIEGLDFRDPVDSVNAAVEELEASDEEYDVIVASYHEGASGNGAPGEAPANSDPIFDRIVTETSSEVDAIFNGDSHQTYAYDAPVPGQDGEVRPIVQTGSSGANLGSVTLQLGDDEDWDVVEGGTELIPTENTDPADCAGDDTYEEAATVVADAVANAEEAGSVEVGTIADDITTSWGSTVAEYDEDGIRRTQDPVTDQANTKGDDRSRHSAAGDMLADSMTWWLENEGAAQDHEVIGWMNPGGIRAELWYDAAGADGDGVVTYAEANSMVPFGNTLNTGEVTGAQFVQMLEEQWQRDESGAPTSEFLAFSVSDNVRYTFDSTAGMDEHITEVRIDGEPIDLEATYTIVTASFLFEGGDNMWTLSEASDVSDSGVLDRDAFIQYLQAHPGLEPDYSQRQLDLQVLDAGEYDSDEDVDRDPVLRIGGLESLSLGAPRIESVVVDAGEYGTFEAPYAMVEELGRAYGDVTLTDWLCVPEGTVVPLSITAIPDTGTAISVDAPAFTWTSGGAPDSCTTDDDEGATPPPSDGGGDDQGGDDQGDDGAEGDGAQSDDTAQGGDDQVEDTQGEDTQGDAQGGDEGNDSQDDDTVTPVVDDTTGGASTDGTTAGETPSDLARTGADVGPLAAVIGFLTLAGLGGLGLRHRLSRR